MEEDGKLRIIRRGARGDQMTELEFESLLAPGYETNGVEFKGPGVRTVKPFHAKVVRAILGMANRRDGGLVIIGVESTNLEPVGLNDLDLATWSDYDVLAESVNGYASPSVSFDTEILSYHGNNIFIIRVREFEEIPILCTKDYSDPEKSVPTLRRGACYVRSRHKSETSEIPSEEEMRELLELAIDKGVRRFVARAQRAGLFSVVPAAPPSPSDEELFRKQIEDMG
jgi:predicted HTH transcriptional regulator